MAEITDIAIYESGDGGDFSLLNGDLELISGLTNQVYLALFGGNVEQSTTEDIEDGQERSDWWGNEYLDIEQQFNSTFERTINKVALTTSGISDLENAALSDLDFLKEYAEITVEGELISTSQFSLNIVLQKPDNTSETIKFIWDNTKKEVIEYITL